MLVTDITTERSFSILGLLNGKEFDENVQIHIHQTGPIRDRIAALTSITAGRNVVHVGCCDHLQSIDGRRSSGRWLHDHLSASAARCLGVDIDREAISYLVESGLDNVHCADICSSSSSSLLEGAEWDMLLVPEVLEHLGNPVQFLQDIRATHGAVFQELVLTVPNALRGGSLKGALRGREIVNSDHRFYFTPFTILKVVTDAGYTATSLEMVGFSKGSGWRAHAKNVVLRQAPMLAEDILVRARFS